MAMAIAILGMR
jgi:hypothetical protein